MTVLHVFDMDGTLLRGSSASVEVARQSGTLGEVMALEGALAAGQMGPGDFAAALLPLWRGLTNDLVAAAFAAGPWLDGIAGVCADIRERGERCAVITMSPDFFARRLLALGFDEVVASRFPPLPFTAAPDPAGILRPDDKVRIVAELCARHSLAMAECVAYGDSLSDAPLFLRLTRTVAVNADHHVAGLAALRYDGDDLMGAYQLARSLLDPSPAR